MGIRTWGLALLGVLIIGEQSLGGTSKLSQDEKMNIAHTRCAPKTAEEPILFRTDVQTNKLHSLTEMSEVYEEVYNSERRLPNRVGLNEQTGEYISTDGRYSVTFPEHMIKTITLHIEAALKNKVADFIFLPDMGHSHFFIPLSYHQRFSKTDGSSFHDHLNRIFRDKPEGLKSLYHTAEHLKTHTDRSRSTLVTDIYTQWRFFTRNPVFDEYGNLELITNLENSKANTARELEGSHYIGGVNISANKNGCFPFENQRGEIQYFDISAWDLSTDCSRADCSEKKKYGAR